MRNSLHLRSRPAFLIKALFILIFSLAPSTTTRADQYDGPKPSNSSVLTLWECYRKILAHNPLLKMKKTRIEQAVADLRSDSSLVYPRLVGSSAATNSDNPVHVFSTLLSQESFSESNFDIANLNDPDSRTNFNFALETELPIFNAFQTVSKIRISKSHIRAKEEAFVFMRMKVSLLTVASHLGVLWTKEVSSLIHRVIQEAEEDIRQAEELKAKGMILGADFYAAKVIFSMIQQMSQKMNAQHQASKTMLNLLMGESLNQSYTITGELPSQPREIRSLEAWLEDAYILRQDLVALQERIQAQEIEIFREGASILPQVKLFGRVEENTHEFDTGGESYLMGVKGSMNLFDPSYRARKEKVKAVLKELKASEILLKDRIAQSLIESHSKTQILRQNLVLVNETLQNAEEAVKLTAGLYREGRKSIADLLEMRQVYLEFAQRRLEIMYRLEYEDARLLFLTGQLDEAKIKEIAKRIGDTEE